MTRNDCLDAFALYESREQELFKRKRIRFSHEPEDQNDDSAFEGSALSKRQDDPNRFTVKQQLPRKWTAGMWSPY